MPPRLMAVVVIVSLAACSPSPQQFLPANPVAGASGVTVHIGGCSPATSPCE